MSNTGGSVQCVELSPDSTFEELFRRLKRAGNGLVDYFFRELKREFDRDIVVLVEALRPRRNRNRHRIRVLQFFEGFDYRLGDIEQLLPMIRFRRQ